jgi:hypothetical protein
VAGILRSREVELKVELIHMAREIIRSRVLQLLTLVVLGVAPGCTSSSASATSAPSPAPTPTEQHSGTVAQLGTAGFPFTVSSEGEVTISLTDIEPLATMALGVGVSTWDGSACGLSITKNDNARMGISALGGIATPGNYCAMVYDSGNVPADWTVSFTVQVVHP